uniref:Uncharacterized protein n=1 Tax=Rhizophora mucronata TaxID=61149 RepID=A0A2P2P5F6_RHIMU
MQNFFFSFLLLIFYLNAFSKHYVASLHFLKHVICERLK